MKKAIYTVTALAGIMSAQAHVSSTSLDGFSIGLQGAYGMGDSKVDRSTTTLATNISDRSEISQRGALGGAHLEYGHVFGNAFFAGLHLNALFGSVKGNAKTNVNFAARPISTSVKLKHSYGAALRLGKTFMGTVLPYAKVGVVSSKWYSTTDAMPLIGKGNTSKHRAGFEFGAGVDFSINSCVAVGAEFSHLEYQRLSYDVKNNFQQIVRKVRVKPRENRAMLRVKYKLGR